MLNIKNPNANGVKGTDNSSTNPLGYSSCGIKPNEIEDGDRKSLDVLKWAGIIAAGTLGLKGVGYLAKNSAAKIPNLELFGKKESTKLYKINNDVIRFENGKALLLNDTGYTGTFRHNDAFLSYKNGLLEHAKKYGKDGFNKYYKDGKFQHGTYTLKTKTDKGETLKHIHAIHFYDKDGKLIKTNRNGKFENFNYNTNPN